MLRLVPATRDHAEELAANLRDADRAEGLAMGLDPAAEALGSWEATRWPLAGVTGEGVVALFGVIDGGGLLAPTHHPWLLSTPLAERNRVGFARAARTVVAGWQAKYRRLENAVDARYTRSVALIAWLGFTLGEPFPALPHGIPFRRFWWSR